jgi:hypothetical protein
MYGKWEFYDEEYGALGYASSRPNSKLSKKPGIRVVGC